MMDYRKYLTKKIKFFSWLCIMACMSCAPATEKLKEEIINTDRAFSQLSKEKGTKVAFTTYAAEDVIKPSPGNQPIVGLAALIKSYEGREKDNFELTWEPLKVDASGAIGYTFGNYYLKRKTKNNSDTTLYGNYTSIWKKQKDGNWRFVLDTGNPTPQPTILN